MPRHVDYGCSRHLARPRLQLRFKYIHLGSSVARSFFFLQLLSTSTSSVSRLSLLYNSQLTANMNGLRNLASKHNWQERGYYFDPDKDYNYGTTIEVLPSSHGSEVDYCLTKDVDDSLLVKFLEHRGLDANAPGYMDQGENRRTHHEIKLVVLASGGRTFNYPYINESIFHDLMKTVSPDPIFNRKLHAKYRAIFEYTGSIANGGIAAMKFMLSRSLSTFSIRQREENAVVHFESRCVTFYDYDDDEATQSFEYNRLSDCLEYMKEEAHSPLYLPFSLSVYAINSCRDILSWVDDAYTEVARTTSHGRFGYEDDRNMQTEREDFVKQNGAIGYVLSNAAYVTSRLKATESLWQYLESMADDISPSAKTEQVVKATNNILEAIQFLRQETKVIREVMHDYEVRIRDQSMLVSFPISPS